MSSLQIPVRLDRLSPDARSWVIAKSAQSAVDPETLARDLIEKAARQDGFIPKEEKGASK